MKVILHIGWHKTGTSSLQTFLSKNRTMLLEHHGILYPDTGFISHAHHKLAWSLQDPLISQWAKKISFRTPAEEIFTLLFTECRNKNAETVLLSSEEFSLTEKYNIKRLESIIAPHQITIVAYIRRQDKYLESLYNQLIKTSFMRYKLDFGRFIENKIKEGGLNYMDYFSKWSDALPGAEFIIRPYERELLPQNDICHDFLNQILKNPGQDFAFNPKEENESLGFRSVEFIRRMNRISIGEGQHQKIVMLLKQMEKEKKQHRGLLSGTTRQEILDTFQQSNQQFSVQYFGGVNPFLLNESEKNETLPEYTEDDFITMLAGILPELLKSDL
jgi:hypothetical protein